MRRGQKFDWLYDQCCDQHIFDSLIALIGTATLRTVLQYIKSTQHHDQRGALICLLTAAAVAVGRYTAVGDPDGGYFFLPPWDAWDSWARQEIDTQRRRMDSVEIWIDGARFTALGPLP